jgi:hypothetical protein
MRVLVTVGSTKFDALVRAALSQSVLDALFHKSYTDLVIQCGGSHVDEFDSKDVERSVHKNGLNIDVWRFKPSLDEAYDAADLVIGHAGLCSPLSCVIFFCSGNNTVPKPRELSRLRDHTRCTAEGQTSHNCTQPNSPRQSSGRYGSCYGVIRTRKGINAQVSVGSRSSIFGLRSTTDLF